MVRANKVKDGLVSGELIDRLVTHAIVENIGKEDLYNITVEFLEPCLSKLEQKLGSSLFPFLCFYVIQSRVACTPPRRKPLESDFETIKLISNGAYG